MLSSPVELVSVAPMLKALKWSMNLWSVFSNTFVDNSMSLLTIYRFSWNKMVSNKSQVDKANQSKTWSTKTTLVSFKLWSTTSDSNKPQMVSIEQRILISQVLLKVSTKKVVTAILELFLQRRHAATVLWQTNVALLILRLLSILKGVFICSNGKWNFD